MVIGVWLFARAFVEKSLQSKLRELIVHHFSSVIETFLELRVGGVAYANQLAAFVKQPASAPTFDWLASDFYVGCPKVAV